jgi:N-succinyldiaminopimelate aminotransferase
VAGDANLLRSFLLYRTYHGSAMSSAVQQASIAAWCDEEHVRVNRALYREKFTAVTPMLARVMATAAPEAGFYLWARVPGGARDAGDAGRDDERFARELYAAANVTVLPGQYLAREAHGVNPGRGFVRIALVPELDDCLEAARRIAAFCR